MSKKIAMLNCLKSNRVCTGAACLKAFNERTDAFAMYQGEEAVVSAFMRCNGCEADPDDDAGIKENIERLSQEGITTVHVGICTKKDGSRCKVIEKMINMIQAEGIQIIDGTHGS